MVKSASFDNHLKAELECMEVSKVAGDLEDICEQG